MNWAGNTPKLTEDQARELQRRYQLFRANRPKVLAREYGLTETMFHRYATGRIKRYAQETRHE